MDYIQQVKNKCLEVMTQKEFHSTETGNQIENILQKNKLLEQSISYAISSPHVISDFLSSPHTGSMYEIKTENEKTLISDKQEEESDDEVEERDEEEEGESDDELIEIKHKPQTQLELVDEVEELSHQISFKHQHTTRHSHKASMCKKMTRLEMLHKDSESVLGTFRPVVNPNFKAGDAAALDKTITKLARNFKDLENLEKIELSTMNENRFDLDNETNLY